MFQLVVLITFNFKTRRTPNTKLGNALTFAWIQHKKRNTYKIISCIKSPKETLRRTTVVENSNDLGIHCPILFNNGYLFRKFLIKCSCSYFPWIGLSEGDQIILQWQYISNSSDFLWHTFTGSIGKPSMTGKRSNLFFSSASIAWFRIKDCLKVIFIGYFFIMHDKLNKSYCE